MQRLFLDRLLELDVGLVGDVQGHFQFGDVQLELLLDAGHLGLEFGLSLNQTTSELLNLDGGLLAEEIEEEISVGLGIVFVRRCAPVKLRKRIVIEKKKLVYTKLQTKMNYKISCPESAEGNESVFLYH